MNSSWAWRVAVLLFVLFASSAHPATKETQADLFKQFIESPLPCEIVFEERLLRETNFVFGRWQTNAYFYNKATNYDQAVLTVPNERPNGAGRFENEYWRLSDKRIVSKWVDQGDPTDTNNAAYFKSNLAAQSLKQALNFGIPHRGFAAIRWNQDSFVFTNWSGFRGGDMIISGKLKRDAQDRAGSMDVQLQAVQEDNGSLVGYRTVQWQIIYFYEKDIGKPFLPSRYVTYVTTEEKPRWRAFETKILKMEFFSRARDAKYFQPALLMPEWNTVDLPQGFRNSKAGLKTRKALLGTELGARLFPTEGDRGGTIIVQGTNRVLVDKVTGKTNAFPSTSPEITNNATVKPTPR